VRALVLEYKGVNASALCIALSFLLVYYSKNEEYCLDLIRLACLHHNKGILGSYYNSYSLEITDLGLYYL
jgi:hypothetical protein